jgi:hypothetical protein
MPSGRQPPTRPLAVELAALGLVVGGLIGISQVFDGSYVVTGSLPAKAPIVGVALVAYLATVAMGLLLRTGRGWLAAVNLAALTALVYLPAAGRPLIAGLVAGHALVVVGLVVARPWFAELAAWRRDRAAETPHGAGEP